MSYLETLVWNSVCIFSEISSNFNTWNRNGSHLPEAKPYHLFWPTLNVVPSNSINYDSHEANCHYMGANKYHLFVLYNYSLPNKHWKPSHPTHNSRHQCDPATSHIFPSQPHFTFRRHHSLLNSLVHSSLPTKTLLPSWGTFPCYHRRCNTCPPSLLYTYFSHIRPLFPPSPPPNLIPPISLPLALYCVPLLSLYNTFLSSLHL